VAGAEGAIGILADLVSGDAVTGRRHRASSVILGVYYRPGRGEPSRVDRHRSGSIRHGEAFPLVHAPLARA
jgi:hypothetical protein